MRQALQVNNGTLGTFVQIDGDRLQVRLDREAERQIVSFHLADYNAIDHGYAATLDRTHLLASRYFDPHSSYVAMSRHRLGADIYVSRE